MIKIERIKDFAGYRNLITSEMLKFLPLKGDYKMKYEIVGREKEIQKLDEILASKEAEFLALYGRRRVGKTYLVRQFFKSKPCVTL